MKRWEDLVADFPAPVTACCGRWFSPVVTPRAIVIRDAHVRRGSALITARAGRPGDNGRTAGRRWTHAAFQLYSFDTRGNIF